MKFFEAEDGEPTVVEGLRDGAVLSAAALAWQASATWAAAAAALAFILSQYHIVRRQR